MEDRIAENKVFETLNKINVSSKIERKNGFTYLSWAWAWGEVKKRYPDVSYKVYENAQGWNYHTDGRTAWVKVGVTIEGQEHIEMLPVMDFKNNSIPIGNITSCNVNKAIQRALTKAIARHGLGLYIYAGEDLPEEDTGTQQSPKSEPKKATSKPKAKPAAEKPAEPVPDSPLICSDCNKTITDYKGQPANKIAEATATKYGVPICMRCSCKRRGIPYEEEEEQAQEEQPAPTPEEGELPFDLYE